MCMAHGAHWRKAFVGVHSFALSHAHIVVPMSITTVSFLMQLGIVIAVRPVLYSMMYLDP